MKQIRGVEEYLYAFLTSIMFIVHGEWLVSLPGHFTHGMQ
jgi:hypothetical protein